MREMVNQFWKMLNLVRGSMPIESVKDPILALTFLKYINDVQIHNFGNLTYIVPEVARWEFILNKSNSTQVYDVVYRAFNELENRNASLEDVFSNINFAVFTYEKGGEHLLLELLHEFNQFNFSQNDIPYEELFDELLYLFGQLSGKRGDNFIQPKELTLLMQSFLPKKEKLKIYNPFAGFGSLGIGLPNNYSYYGEEINQNTANIAKLRMIVHNCSDKCNVSITDSIFYPTVEVEKKFEAIIFNPPFNLKLSNGQFRSIEDERFALRGNANSYIYSQLLKKLDEGGKMIFISPGSFLSSINNKEQELKKLFVNQGYLETVIALPDRILNYTGIPTYLIVLSKQVQKSDTFFIDASDCLTSQKSNLRKIDVKQVLSRIGVRNDGEHTSLVSQQQIHENDYSLIPIRYIQSETDSVDLSEAVKLDSLLEFISPIRSGKELSGKKIGIRELSDNPDLYTIDINEIEESIIPANLAILSDSALLMASKGDKLKPSFYTGNNKSLYYTQHNIFAFKIKNSSNVLIDYLIPELHKDYVKNQLLRFKYGIAIPSIKRDDLLSIKIILPSLKDQASISAVEKRDRFLNSSKELGFNNEIVQLKREQHEDLRIKKHNILQYMNNVKSSADVLIKFMAMNNGTLNADKIISKKHKVTVEKRFELLLESLENAIYFVDNLTNDIAFGKMQKMNIVTLIKNSIEKGMQSDNFETKLIIDEDSFIESESQIEPLVNISITDFQEFYNNIIENAVKHGFIDKNKSYQILIQVSYLSDEKKIEVRFSNNGRPFPKGMAKRFGLKGEKAGKTANKGYGAWKIVEIAKFWNAEFNVIDESNEEYPVTIELKLNLETE